MWDVFSCCYRMFSTNLLPQRHKAAITMKSRRKWIKIQQQHKGRRRHKWKFMKKISVIEKNSTTQLLILYFITFGALERRLPVLVFSRLHYTLHSSIHNQWLFYQQQQKKKKNKSNGFFFFYYSLDHYVCLLVDFIRNVLRPYVCIWVVVELHGENVTNFQCTTSLARRLFQYYPKLDRFHGGELYNFTSHTPPHHDNVW